jgi:hypothetical protein
MEIKVDLHAAERGCNLVDDPRDKLFDVESGGNALRELLQANQFRELQGGRFRRRERGKAAISYGTGGHDRILLPADCNCLMRLSDSGFGFSFCSTFYGIGHPV